MNILSSRKNISTFNAVALLILCCSISSLPAQEKMTGAEVDSLFEADFHKTKLIHFNGEWSGQKSKELLFFFDYLNTHKKNDIEIYVLIGHKNETDKQKFLEWFNNYKLTLNYYLIDYEDTKNYTLDANVKNNVNAETYIIDHKQLSSSTLDASLKIHKKSLLDFVNKDSIKTADELETIYAIKKVSHYPKERINGKEYYLVETRDMKLEGNQSIHESLLFVYSPTKYLKEHHLLKITASGEINFGEGIGTATPKGFPDGHFKELSYQSEVNHGALLVIIKDLVSGNLDAHGVGEEVIFRSKIEGFLKLVINDQEYKNNTGYFEAKVHFYFPALEE